MINLIISGFVLWMSYVAGENGLWHLALAMGICYLIGILISYFLER